jgi:hypothetical protein
MTDEQLNLIRESVNSTDRIQAVLVEIEDYLQQIAFMATIVSHYQFEEDYPGIDKVQVRMIGRLAERAFKMLEPASEKLDSAARQTSRILWGIELERMREQEEKAKHDSKIINLLQVAQD